MPKRIQLSRAKGWRMPPNTVNVARPGKWGNRYSVAEYGRELAVFNHMLWIRGILLIDPKRLEPLRGKDLACWCKPGEPCHADVLLELANPPLSPVTHARALPDDRPALAFTREEIDQFREVVT